MAATPSPWRLPLKYSTTTTTSLPFSTRSPIHPLKRRRIVTSCSHNSSRNSTVPNTKPVDDITITTTTTNADDYVALNSVKLRRIDADGGLEPSHEKRALWRRIFFASRKVRGIILLNVITIIYASNIPVVKEVEAIIDPEAFTVVRFAVAAIPFIPFVFMARDDAETRNAGILLGFWVSLGYILQAVGLQTSDAGRASFITMFTVIVVPLIDGLLGSKIPARTWFGAVMSLVGVGMLESSGSPPCIGDLLNFLSAVSFGIHMLTTEHISRGTKRENFLPLLGYQICTVAFFSTTWYCIEGWLGGDIQEANPFSWTWELILGFPWIPALYTGILSTSLCLWVEMTAMRDVSATETAIIYGLEPVWGAGFAWFFLGERWGVSGWIGAALVLAGSLMVQIMGAKSDPLPRESTKGGAEAIDFLISDKQTSFSASPVVLKTRKRSTESSFRCKRIARRRCKEIIVIKMRKMFSSGEKPGLTGGGKFLV